nr:MAG TPA: hypothetical protein [Caudoviricetes sp.]
MCVTMFNRVHRCAGFAQRNLFFQCICNRTRSNENRRISYVVRR